MTHKLPLTAKEFYELNDVAAIIPSEPLPDDQAATFTSAVFFVLAAEVSTWTPELVRRARLYKYSKEEYFLGVESLLQKLLMSVRRDILVGIKREEAALERAFEGKKSGDVLAELVVPSIQHDLSCLRDLLHEAEYRLRATSAWNTPSRRQERAQRLVLEKDEKSL